MISSAPGEPAGGGEDAEAKSTAGRREDAPLLERERELEAIEGALADACEGGGGILFVEAAPGLGKSRLAAAAEALISERGMGLLAARGSELESSYPGGVVLQLFERRLRDAKAAERKRLLAGSAALAEPLFGLQAAGAAHPEPEQEFSLLHGLHWMTANLAEERPLAIVVDDAHWADPLSLRYLLYLANRVQELPIAVVAASRPRPGEEAGEALLRDLVGHPAARALRPAPLSRAAVGRLLEHYRIGTGAGAADERVLDACFEVTRGNPFFVRELAIALIAEGLQGADDVAERILQLGPEPVSRAIAVALWKLPRSATSLARALAVLGDDLDLAPAAELAQLDRDAAASAASALVDAGILERASRLAFAHPIVRSALYEELAPPERSVAHRRAAGLLAERRAAPERVAAHLLRSDPGGHAWAVEALAAAGSHAAERGAPAAAAAYLERALAEAPGERPDLILELARSRATAGDPAAREDYEQAIAQVGPARERAALLGELGRSLYLQSRFGEAADAFERGMETLGDPRDPISMHLAAGRSAALIWAQGPKEDPFAHLEPLLERAQEAATLPERAVLANLAGAEMMRIGNRRRALELAMLAWGDGALLGEGPTRAEPSVLAVTAALNIGGDNESSIAVAEAMIEEARSRGLVLSFATFSYVRAFNMLMLGRLAEAVADADQALSARAYGWRLFLPAALWVAAVARVERGELDEARALVDLSPEDEESARAMAGYGALPLARGEVALAGDDPESAVEHLSQGGQLLDLELGQVNPGLLDPAASLARALAAAGKREEALAAAEDNLERARAWGAPRALAVALRARGLAEGGAGAIQWFEEAASQAREGEALLAYAQSMVDLGVAKRVAGKRTAARDALREGLDAASGCGAAPLAARAREELVVAGGRPRRERVRGVEGLTPSELRVAGMAASGLTNREIAEALFVTVKAVEYHLGNVFRKLDVGRRGELQAALEAEPGAA